MLLEEEKEQTWDGRGKVGCRTQGGRLCRCRQLVPANSSSCIFLSTYYVPGLF